MDEIPKSYLAKTLEHHRASGSTNPPEILVNNPGKTLLETMSDEEVDKYATKSFEEAEEAHKEACKGNERAKRILATALKFLIMDFDYMREAGRLPAKYADLDIKNMFSL